MSIKYSNLPCVYREYSIDTTLEKFNGMIEVLLEAGWRDLGAISPTAYMASAKGVTQPGRRLRSLKTPQGLQMLVDIYYAGRVWVQPKTYNGSGFIEQRSLKGFAWTGQRERMIANGYQFFTFMYRDLNSSGTVINCGVPWVSDFHAPYRIATLTPGNPVRFTVLNDPGWPTQTPVTVDGVEGVTGVDGPWTAQRVDEVTFDLLGCNQPSGSYLPFTGIVGGPGQIVRFIYAQSSGYLQGWLDATPANTWRQRLQADGGIGLFVGEDAGTAGVILNSHAWAISGDAYDVQYIGNAGTPRIWPAIPYNKLWYGEESVGYEPLIHVCESSVSGVYRLSGQIWDAIACNLVLPRLDQMIFFDNATWHTYTNNQSNDGVLLLKVDVS